MWLASTSAKCGMLSEGTVGHSYTDHQILQQISKYHVSDLSNGNSPMINKTSLIEGAVVFRNLHEKLRKKPPES